MIDKEIKLAFKRWYEAAREIEPFLNRGISEQDIFCAGRDSMKAECVKAVHNCLNDYVFTAEMAGHAGRHLQLAENAIKELK